MALVSCQWCRDLVREREWAKHRAACKRQRRNGSTAEHRRVRARALERAGHRCEDCGITAAELRAETGRALQAHHLDGNHLNNQDQNIEVLCPPCHARAQRDESGERASERRARAA
jgi:5-methylcytosine-specific restriction endonuclease McrA